MRVENAGCQVQPKLATTSGPPASSGQTWITASSGQIWTKGSVAASEQRCSRVLASHGQPRVPQDEASAEDGRHEVSSFTVRKNHARTDMCIDFPFSRRARHDRVEIYSLKSPTEQPLNGQIGDVIRLRRYGVELDLRHVARSLPWCMLPEKWHDWSGCFALWEGIERSTRRWVSNFQ